VIKSISSKKLILILCHLFRNIMGIMVMITQGVTIMAAVRKMVSIRVVAMEVLVIHQDFQITQIWMAGTKVQEVIMKRNLAQILALCHIKNKIQTHSTMATNSILLTRTETLTIILQIAIKTPLGHRLNFDWANTKWAIVCKVWGLHNYRPSIRSRTCPNKTLMHQMKERKSCSKIYCPF